MKIRRRTLEQIIRQAFLDGIDSRDNAERKSDMVSDRVECVKSLMQVAEDLSGEGM